MNSIAVSAGCPEDERPSLMAWYAGPRLMEVRGGMARLRSMLLAACCIAVHAPLPAAATVTIDGNEPRQRITVIIQDATTGAALRDLGRTYGFEINGALASDAKPVSITVSGSLDDVLTRLLRNVNHVIVRAPGSPSGIAKVIITGRSAAQPGSSAGIANGAPTPPEPPSSAQQGD
jgi:hypothetical protein